MIDYMAELSFYHYW